MSNYRPFRYTYVAGGGFTQRLDLLGHVLKGLNAVRHNKGWEMLVWGRDGDVIVEVDE